MGVVCGATPHTMVVQQYCCYCPSGAPAACGVPRRTNMTQRHVVHACRVMKRAVFVALLLFARDGIQRVIAPPAPVGRPAGKKSRAGAGKPGPPSQADKRRKIVETKRHDSRWKRWSGVGGGIEQGGEPTAVAEFRRRVGYCPNGAPPASLQDRHDGGDAFTQGAYCSVLLWCNCLYWDVLL